MKQTEIKWFSAINQESLEAYKTYIGYYTKAVISARKNSPSLIPYLILDGDETDENIVYLKEVLNVKIIKHKLSFYNELKAYYKDDTTASGAYLRCDIPIILERESIMDDYVLYTDNDVLFFDDVSDLKYFKPKYFCISSEFTKDQYKDINSGVMYINTKNMKDIYQEFRTFIINNFDKFKVYDQTAIILFFDKKMDLLPYQYNYKPYWGKEDNIKILHFHGPKPWHIDMCKAGTYPLMNIVSDYYYECCEIYNDLSL